MNRSRLETIARLAYGGSTLNGWEALEEHERDFYCEITEAVLRGDTYKGLERQEAIAHACAEAWDAAVTWAVNDPVMRAAITAPVVEETEQEKSALHSAGFAIAAQTQLTRKAGTGCWCWECNPDATWYVLCPICGNKRCPKATHHDHACTNSNEPGQKGSIYE